MPLDMAVKEAWLTSCRCTQPPTHYFVIRNLALRQGSGYNLHLEPTVSHQRCATFSSKSLDLVLRSLRGNESTTGPYSQNVYIQTRWSSSGTDSESNTSTSRQILWLVNSLTGIEMGLWLTRQAQKHRLSSGGSVTSSLFQGFGRGMRVSES